MNTPAIDELCQGEINDFLLSLVQNCLNNIPPEMHSRRRDLCEAILQCNHFVGKRGELKESLSSVLRTWCARQDQIHKLVGLGFCVTKGKTHYKVRKDRYFIALPTSPSDHRSGINAVANSVATFF